MNRYKIVYSIGHRGAWTTEVRYENALTAADALTQHAVMMAREYQRVVSIEPAAAREWAWDNHKLQVHS